MLVNITMFFGLMGLTAIASSDSLPARWLTFTFGGMLLLALTTLTAKAAMRDTINRTINFLEVDIPFISFSTNRITCKFYYCTKILIFNMKIRGNANKIKTVLDVMSTRPFYVFVNPKREKRPKPYFTGVSTMTGIMRVVLRR